MPAVSNWRLSAWYFFYFAYVGAFAPYFTLYLQSLGFSGWDIGLLMAVGPVMRALAPTFWGALSDRSGKRVPIIRFSAAATAAGFAVFFFATGFWGVLLGIVLSFFFWSAAHPLVEALTLDRLVDRTEDYGRIRMWGSVGFIVTVLGLGALLDAAPVNVVLWVCLGLLLGVAASAVGLEESPHARPPEGGTSLRAGLLRPTVVALMAACFFMSAAHGPLYVFFSIHLVDYGYGKTAVGALWSLGVIAEIGVFAFLPRLMARYSVRAILLASFALAVLRFLLIGWEVESTALIFVAQLMHGATFGAYHAAAVTALNRWFPTRQQGRVQAIYGSISFGAGGMLGNFVSGIAWGPWGAGWTYTLGAAFALVGWALVWRGVRAGPGLEL
ncbi:MAG: MFS transporter [Ignavibacteria bacterium]